jgi:hypothetical protein
MAPRVLVLGEGQDEEGADYYVAHDPGQPIDEERLGSAHILVRRIFRIRSSNRVADWSLAVA